MKKIKTINHGSYLFEVWQLGTGARYVRQVGYRLWTKLEGES